jgi:hypothetical protein
MAATAASSASPRTRTLGDFGIEILPEVLWLHRLFGGRPDRSVSAGGYLNVAAAAVESEIGPARFAADGLRR